MYIVHNDIVYRQIVGIPMGTSSGPHIANCYLHVYEYNFIQSLIASNDEVSLKKLMCIFRYQDDLIPFNDEGLIGKLLSSIYPPEMVVICTNVSPRKCNYLDMTISIFRGKFKINLYDKRVDYNFKVISYLFIDGNIPTNRSYGVFIPQLVRFSNVNTTLKGFLEDVQNLIDKLSCQGFNFAQEV